MKSLLLLIKSAELSLKEWEQLSTKLAISASLKKMKKKYREKIAKEREPEGN